MVTGGHTSLPTAAGLLAAQPQRGACIFCDKSHDSQACVSAQTMPYGLKKRKILDNQACLSYSCLKIGHMAKACKSHVRCLMCQKMHVTLMCPDLETNKKTTENLNDSNVENTAVLSQLNCTNEVLLHHSETQRSEGAS